MLFMSLFMLLAAGVSFVSAKDTSFYPLLLSALLTALLGSFPLVFVEKQSQISTKEGYCIVVGSWLLACFVTMFPYLIWGGEFTLVNAWFESVSGLTTTGASILTDVEILPRGLLFWRMMSTWIGGMGVILFTLIILPTIGRSKMKLSNMELSAIAKENYKYRTQMIIHIILFVYVGLTVVTTLSLKAAGMNWFDALTHGMSTAATSGFGTKNSSIASFDSAMIEWIIIFGMVAAGTHFGLIYATLTGKRNNIFRSEVMKVYIGMIVVCSLMIGVNLYFEGIYPEPSVAFRRAMFQFVSLFTTTGYATADSTLWPPFTMTLLIFASIVCACSGSTTGGIKTNRMVIAAKMFYNSMRQQQHPNAVLKVKIDGVIQERDTLHSVAIFIILYLTIILVGALVSTMFGIDVVTAFSTSIACIGNVGPGFGEVGSLDNYASLPTIVKCVLSFMMLLGRLEIFGLIQLFFLKWWR
ncbi:MAG: TrkH family potassium uptake protein [Rikenellaceae bacterium]